MFLNIFIVSQGSLHTTEKTYKYHMQVQDDEEETGWHWTRAAIHEWMIENVKQINDKWVKYTVVEKYLLKSLLGQFLAENFYIYVPK